MRGLNKLTLISNFSNGPVAMAKFALATSETWRDKSGQLHTSPDWHTAPWCDGTAWSSWPRPKPTCAKAA